MNVLLVPTLALDDADLITRFASTVDYPVKHKVVVNNGRREALDAFATAHPDWTILCFGRNLGCAESWNLFPRMFPVEEACLICNDDEELQPGCLERICKFSDAHNKECSVIYVNRCESLGYFVWTRRGTERLGLFDENFWPAYREDWDMKARLRIAGGEHLCIVPDLSFPVKHGKPSECSASYHLTLERMWSVDASYFIRKWGNLDDWHSWMESGPRFKTPFNNPNLTLRDWDLDKAVRAKREAIWREWWDKPSYSLYK